ncbi:23S rRNA pseudouridine(2605) synthase RluB [Ferrimonas lipolytica]|uniref:Pseudouridine synthase n=1 Tax=Ferrimonas lipolytica TaxID=2724191 RepID=A0A6H1UA01_9GAMM|nr:23S rRNA pseudouridine(2605) synthase RluB [Ferrimonas lipolytica]QIZ75877.1 23S rRNA pseudouridine(2605) synthase RluB [Ferrimonas lipolytica]
MSEKLQKVLARAGHGSRREMETVIAAGRVSIDGQVAKLGDRIEGGSDLKVRIDGNLISLKSEDEVICRVLAYYKPEGELCTRTDPQGRPTVFDRLPKIKDSRWVAVGRLDINTSGLLLFTTDGELANRLMHPSHEVEREYAIRVFGEVDDAMLNRLRTGVDLEDGKASFRRLGRAGGEGLNTWYHGVLTEGRNREVRRMWESQEVQVSRLMRIRYGEIPLPKGLPRGGWIELPMEQVNYLRAMVEMDPETRTLLAQDKAGARRQKTLKTNKIRRAVSKHRSRGAGGNAPAKRSR